MGYIFKKKSGLASLKRERSGQVMILSVVMLGGVLLSGSAIAGVLMLYQIRAANDSVNSAKAVFAADAGLEDATWCAFKGGILCSADAPLTLEFEDPTVSADIDYNLVETQIYITSRGYAASGKVIRILETIFETPAP